jgi:quinate dehydrogenase (quinone)
MPQLGVEPLTEKSMWGVTPFDQLMCRIDFKESTIWDVHAAVREAVYRMAEPAGRHELGRHHYR